MNNDPWAAPEVRSALALVWDTLPAADRGRFDALIEELALKLIAVDDAKFYAEMTRVGQEIIDGAAALIPEATPEQRQLVFARTIALAERVKARASELRVMGTV